MRDLNEVLAWLTKQKAVSHATRTMAGTSILVTTRDEALVAKLVKRGATVRWYDRTEFSTQKGAEPTMEAEVILGPRFFEEQQ